MREIIIEQLKGQEVRLYLPLTKESDVIFRLGENTIGCVDADLQRHYDYAPVGKFFDAYSFYSKEYVDSIRWVDCGMFDVEYASSGSLMLINEDGGRYTLSLKQSEADYGLAIMEEAKTFQVNTFSGSLK